MWVDLLADEISRERSESRHVVNDAKSPSGRVTVGALRGVLLHDCVTRALRDRGVQAEFLYGYDDFDPMDGLPPGREDLAPYLGVPLCNIPAPDPSAADSFAQFYADEFTLVFNRLGAAPKIYWTSELYRSGFFDAVIRIALDHAREIAEIDRAISGGRRADRHPVQVICEACGKVGTTVLTGWDGEMVSYACVADKVTWAKGCGHQGRRSPLGGASKLQYVTEWAAKWHLLGVTVEGAGKDHMTRGGSHDRAGAIVEAVFGSPRPFPIAYEWFLVGGRKMSTSKGVGMTAVEFADLLRPELARFSMIRPHYKQHVDFEPDGDTIPLLYDEFDRGADAYFGRREDPELSRTFHYSHPSGSPVDTFSIGFSTVAHLCQIPSVDIWEQAERRKGSPLTADDRLEMETRLADAQRWLSKYAPDAQRFEVQQTLPESAAGLSEAQRRFLAGLIPLVESRLDGEKLQEAIHSLKGEHALSPRAAFGAIYQVFLGRDSGPQAGWFLAALDRDFVAGRLREASGQPAAGPERSQ